MKVKVKKTTMHESFQRKKRQCIIQNAIFAILAIIACCGIAIDGGEVIGLYILHPNNIGRCGHIANASYAVGSAARGKGAGRLLVEDSLAQGRANGFRVMQFNAVVASNAGARHLYEKLGFVQLGTIPGGFRMPDGSYADICPYYHEL